MELTVEWTWTLLVCGSWATPDEASLSLFSMMELNITTPTYSSTTSVKTVLIFFLSREHRRSVTLGLFFRSLLLQLLRRSLQWLLKIPSHLKRVATLPWEILAYKINITVSLWSNKTWRLSVFGPPAEMIQLLLVVSILNIESHRIESTFLHSGVTSVCLSAADHTHSLVFFCIYKGCCICSSALLWLCGVGLS